MASTDILKRVFEHQLLLTQEIKEQLKDHLTEELIAAFADNEEFLKKLQAQEEVQQPDLERLQKMWENLTQSIDRMQANLNTEIDTLQKQESLNHIYNR